MQRNRSGYYSSDEKDIIREHFDLPLLRTLHERKDGGLTYFGLPGAEARDIKAWQEIIKEVVAVDRNSNYLDDLEQVILAQLPNIAYSTHLGELDEIILRNMGDERLIDGESHRPEVGNEHSFIRSTLRSMSGNSMSYTWTISEHSYLVREEEKTPWKGPSIAVTHCADSLTATE